jgi:uncharacterized membrane protein YoaK (UPF0700 family)
MNENVSDFSKFEARVHYLVAFIGGFLGLFPIVNVAKVLGSAQTTNLIDIVLSALVGDGRLFVFHAVGALLFCFSVFLATVLPKHSKIDIRLLAMLFNSACAVVMWLFPMDLPAVLYLYPTFFALSFQWCAFKGAYGFICSTIFSTNNLRMCISAFTEVFFNGDRSFLLKAVFFGATLLSFHSGIALSWLCYHFLGNSGFLFALVPCAACFIAVLLGKRRS